MQLIDEYDGATLILSDLLQYRFQTLFELTSVLSTRQESGHIERQDSLILKRVWHLSIHNPLSQSFNNGCLSHTRLTDQDGIIFSTSLQYLDGPTDLVITADHRIKLSHPSTFGQVEGVLLERLSGTL